MTPNLREYVESILWRFQCATCGSAVYANPGTAPKDWTFTEDSGYPEANCDACSGNRPWTAGERRLVDEDWNFDFPQDTDALFLDDSEDL